MDCNWLSTNIGYDCRPIRTLNNERAIEIGTPFSYADGEAIGLYAIDIGNSVKISDNGDTLAHLCGVGLSYHDKRRWASIRSRLEPFGITLEDTGEIAAIAGKENTPDLIARFIAGLLAITTYEREALLAPIDTHFFADEVEIALRAWRPREALTLRPRVRGISRHEHSFDFQLGHRLIDALVPNAAATGGLLRKAGDVRSGPYAENMEVMVIIDDRDDPRRAHMERDIVSSMVAAMLFSSLSKPSDSEGPPFMTMH